MYVCICNAVSDRAIKDAVQAGATRLCDLSRTLRVATCCGRCAPSAQACLDAAVRELRGGVQCAPPTPGPPPLTAVPGHAG